MWKLEVEERPVEVLPGNVVHTKHEILIADDGVRIQHVSTSREGIKTLRYTDGSLSFEFGATRCDVGGGDRILDTYEVFLAATLIRLAKLKLNERTIEEIKNHIESALRAWPPKRLEQNIPIRKVVFHPSRQSNQPQ